MTAAPRAQRAAWDRWVHPTCSTGTRSADRLEDAIPPDVCSVRLGPTTGMGQCPEASPDASNASGGLALPCCALASILVRLAIGVNPRVHDLTLVIRRLSARVAGRDGQASPTSGHAGPRLLPACGATRGAGGEGRPRCGHGR